MRPPKHPVIDGSKQCSKCGVSKPHTLEFFTNSHFKAGSICKECSYPSGADLSLNRWREKHSIEAGGNTAWAREQREYYYSETGQRSYKNSHLKKNFGITLEQYEELLSSQGGICALCGTDKPRGRGTFHVDHNHVTGMIRGLLCHSCNTGLGYLQDNPYLVERARLYLQAQVDLPPLALSTRLRGKRKYEDSRLHKLYGVSLAAYEQRLLFQNGVCAICCSSEPKGHTASDGRGSFHVDHDHTTGVFRGLLCSPCNIGIGLLKDDLLLLEQAILYLRRNVTKFSVPLLNERAKCKPKIRTSLEENQRSAAKMRIPHDNQNSYEAW